MKKIKFQSSFENPRHKRKQTSRITEKDKQSFHKTENETSAIKKVEIVIHYSPCFQLETHLFSMTKNS